VSFRRDRKGFIFSLDATLAMLVVMIVMAGIARVGGPELIYGRHGYMRLERYANDSLEVMQLTGAMNSIVAFVNHGDIENGGNLARMELGKILPSEVQFKLVIGDNRLTVYPSDSAGWADAFSNAGELAVATRMSTLSPIENYRVLAWLDDDNDRAFMDEIEWCTGWDVTRTSDETFFREQIASQSFQYYHAIFIPDAQYDFNDQTETNLYLFTRQYGRLVVGGDTLWYNRLNNGTLDVQELYEYLGVASTHIERPPLDSRNTGMHIVDDLHPITTSPYYICYRADYSGENYRMYVYREPETITGNYTENLAEWDNVPEAGGIDLPPWRGIIFRDEFASAPGRKGTGVLFNMRLAQSAMDDNVGRDDWIAFARRAIYWGTLPWKFEPITLYVWRGEELP